MTCEVVRPFQGADGHTLQAGETVDTTGWKWTQQLIDQGYLRVVAFAPAASPVKPRKE